MFQSAPGRNRTYDLRFRKPLLYPLSYGSKALSGLLVGSHKLLRETTRNRRRRADLVLEKGLMGPQKTSEPSQGLCRTDRDSSSLAVFQNLLASLPQ